MARDWQISRRTMLRGMGAAIALPWLEAMAPRAARAAAAKPPVRMGVFFFPNGVWQDAWIPAAEGADYALPHALEPLAAQRAHFSVLSGLDKKASHRGDGHYAKTANFLTGEPVEKTTGKDISAGGISMDQLAAQQLGHLTPLPSLELGIDPVISGIDSNVGYTRLYGSYISWRSATSPVAREINPRYVYERLFGAQDAARARRQADQQSLIDLALDDASRLRGRLGRDDQVKLDEYLESLRAVEKRIEFAAKPDPREWKPAPPGALPPAPSGVPGVYPEHVRLMLDLAVLAFQTDNTRVLSFMFANDVSGRSFSFLPEVSIGHHDASHHENNEEKIRQYKEITRWHAGQFAHVLDRLAAIPEGEGSLLDHCMLLFGSSMSDGNSHNPDNLPIVIAGGAGGRLRQGHHLALPKATPLCNLYLSMLQSFGVAADSFGDSNGRIEALHAV